MRESEPSDDVAQGSEDRLARIRDILERAEFADGYTMEEHLVAVMRMLKEPGYG